VTPRNDKGGDGQVVATQDSFIKLFAELFPKKSKGLVELRALPSKSRLFVNPADRAQIQDFLDEHAGQNLYFGVATRLAMGDGRLANCGDLWALFVDIDFKSTSEAAARKLLDAFPVRPSIVVFTGGGLHPYFLLRTVVDPTRGRAVRSSAVSPVPWRSERRRAGPYPPGPWHPQLQIRSAAARDYRALRPDMPLWAR
jgi:hypothetical protein